MPDLAVFCSLEANLRAVRERIARAAERVGRDPACITLVAVTKSTPPARARELLAAGQTDLGESRASALEAKAAALSDAVPAPRWHCVGHLQRNKVGRVLTHLHALHSLDSVELLGALARALEAGSAVPELFVQIEFGAGTGERTGLAPSDLPALLRAVAGHAGPSGAPLLPLTGLMTIAPLFQPSGTAGSLEAGHSAQLVAARATFRELAEIARSLERRADTARLFSEGRVRLSMGMSDDFEVAIEEGSDLVRIGSALFAGLERGARSPA